MGRERLARRPTGRKLDVVTDKYMIEAGRTTGGNRTLSICRALGQIYVNTEDEEVKLKLRYASTIARYYIYKLREYNPDWVNNFCPRFRDYDRIMRNETESLPGKSSAGSD